MRTGVVIDSACDLPPSYIEEHHIHILPISLRFGSELFIDTRDPAATQEFYRKYVAERNLDADTESLTVEEIKDLFLNNLVLQYDRILLITIAQTRSPIYKNATEASFAILKSYREKRRQAGLGGSFYMNVLDSKNFFTGEAVLVHEAVRLLEEEQLSFGNLRVIIEDLSRHVHAYLIPNDLFYLRNRASQKGDKSVGLLSYHLGGMLDIKPVILGYRGESQAICKERGFDRALERLFEITRAAIDRGLRTRALAMSYAGDPEAIRQKPAFVEFEQYAQSRGITTLMSIMSTTAGVNVGPGAFSLAYIAEPEP